MKIALTSLATVLLACSTSSSPNATPGASNTSSTSVASSAEALLELGRVDADDVQKCRAAAQRCAAGEDAASNPFCERIEQHCDELEAQLAADRAELAQCLERAAACEENATDPAECAAARAACEPTDGEFRARRGRTRACADRAERCLGGGLGGRFGFGRGGAERDADAGDAGTGACVPDDADFVGCCRGHRERGDAGVEGFGGSGRRGGSAAPGRGFRPDRDRDDGDAGSPRPGPGAPFRRAP